MDYYHEDLRELYEGYGSVVRELRGTNTVIHIFDPIDISAVLNIRTVPHIPPLLPTIKDYKQDHGFGLGLGNS